MPYSKNGLQIKYAHPGELGIDVNTVSYSVVGNELLYEVDVNLAELEGGAKNIVSYNFKTKTGATLKSVTALVAEDAAGGTSIDVGLESTNGDTEVDSDGFMAGLAAGTIVQGDEIFGTGALIDTVMTTNGVFSVTTVGTFTAGRIKVRLAFEVL